MPPIAIAAPMHRTDPASIALVASHPSLLKAIVRGRGWFEQLATGRARSFAEIAESEGVTERYVGHLILLAFLRGGAPRQANRRPLSGARSSRMERSSDTTRWPTKGETQLALHVIDLSLRRSVFVIRQGGVLRSLRVRAPDARCAWYGPVQARWVPATTSSRMTQANHLVRSAHAFLPSSGRIVVSTPSSALRSRA